MIDAVGLNADARFFVTREAIKSASGIPIRAVVSYAADGSRLERFLVGR